MKNIAILLFIIVTANGAEQHSKSEYEQVASDKKYNAEEMSVALSYAEEIERLAALNDEESRKRLLELRDPRLADGVLAYLDICRDHLMDADLPTEQFKDFIDKRYAAYRKVHALVPGSTRESHRPLTFKEPKIIVHAISKEAKEKVDPFVKDLNDKLTSKSDEDIKNGLSIIYQSEHHTKKEIDDQYEKSGKNKPFLEDLLHFTKEIASGDAGFYEDRKGRVYVRIDEKSPNLPGTKEMLISIEGDKVSIVYTSSGFTNIEVVNNQ